MAGFIISRLRGFMSEVADWLRRTVWLVIGYFIDQVKVSETWVEELKQLGKQGCVIHVIRSVHLLDSLCIAHFLQKNGLPEIGYVYGLEQWFYRPFRWIYRFMTYKHRTVEDSQHVSKVLDEGGSIIICLRKSPKTLRLHGTEIGAEPIGWLVERVRVSGENIILVAHCFVWGRRPAKLYGGIIDKLFGARESPGFIRAVLQVIRSFRSGNIFICDKVYLKQMVEEEFRSSGDNEIAGQLRDRLADSLDEGRKLVAGPLARSRYRTADLIMKDELLVEFINRKAGEEGVSSHQIEAKCRKLLDEIMPDYHYGFIYGFYLILEITGIFKRVFDGIYFNRDELEEVKKAASKGPLILLPTHRSHLDYILISKIFAGDGKIMVPYIAAGKNLSFWPLGWWFRGSGAFFIRRKFEGDELYKQVLSAYIRRTLIDGNHIEVFMEGTRSRTGKLLYPKLGLFSIILDSVVKTGRVGTTHILPIAINYERVIEEKSYSMEQSGSEKEAESIKGLVESQDVLESKYGRIYVRFAKPIALKQLEKDFPDLTDKGSVKKIAYRVFYEIDKKLHVTPTGVVSAVLMCAPDYGCSEEEFFKGAIFYLNFASATGRLISDVLQPCIDIGEGEVGDGTSERWLAMREVLYHAIHLLAADDLIKMSGAGGGYYYVPPEARVGLEYYKNNYLGTTAPYALACMSIVSQGSETVEIEGLRESADFLSKLFKYEYIFNPTLSFDENFYATLFFLENFGMIEIGSAPGKVSIKNRMKLERISVLVESMVECYLLTVVSLMGFRPGDEVSEREVFRRFIAVHEKLLLKRMIRRVESRNKTAVTFCLRSLRDMNLIDQIEARRFKILADGRSMDKLETIASKIESYLSGRSG